MPKTSGTNAPANLRLRQAGLSHAVSKRVIARRQTRLPVAIVGAAALGVGLLAYGGVTAWTDAQADKVAGVADANQLSKAAVIAGPQDETLGAAISQRADTTAALGVTRMTDTATLAALNAATLVVAAPSGPTAPATAAAVPVVDLPDCVDNLLELTRDVSIGFPPGGTEVSEEGREILRTIGIAARYCPTAVVTVAGHSDPSGDEATNLKLSWDRADNALVVLAEYGLLADNIEQMGFGSRLPFAQGDASEDAENRRIDFQIVRTETKVN